MNSHLPAPGAAGLDAVEGGPRELSEDIVFLRSLAQDYMGRGLPRVAACLLRAADMTVRIEELITARRSHRSGIPVVGGGAGQDTAIVPEPRPHVSEATPSSGAADPEKVQDRPQGFLKSAGGADPGTPLPRPALLTEKEAAAWLRIHQKTLGQKRRAGLIEYIRVFRSVRYRLCDLEAFLEAHSKSAGGPGADRPSFERTR